MLYLPLSLPYLLLSNMRSVDVSFLFGVFGVREGAGRGGQTSPRHESWISSGLSLCLQCTSANACPSPCVSHRRGSPNYFVLYIFNHFYTPHLGRLMAAKNIVKSPVRALRKCIILCDIIMLVLALAGVQHIPSHGLCDELWPELAV